MNLEIQYIYTFILKNDFVNLAWKPLNRNAETWAKYKAYEILIIFLHVYKLLLMPGTLGFKESKE